LPIITNSNEIPKEFNSSAIPISIDGINRIKKIFNLSELVSNRNEILKTVFKTLLSCCERHFGKNKEVSFTHVYRRNGLDVKSGESSVFINDTLLHSLFHYINVVIYHSLDFDNPDVSFYSFKQLLHMMNEHCNNTYSLPGEDDVISVMEKYPNLKTLNVASDVYWGMITFLIIHELSHIFLGHLIDSKKQTIAEQECEADKEAYLIFLDIIYNKNFYKDLDFLEEYIYLAPMMIIDFFTLVNYVDGTINDTRYKSYHPPHEERKDIMFKLFADWECEFDSREGNSIYYWYISVVEKFKNDLFNAKDQGMLESIKRSNKNE
jgi:hypothetical protein